MSDINTRALDPDERRRRFHRVTPEGKRVLAQQRKTWAAFVDAVRA